jgi:hypothetical protein
MKSRTGFRVLMIAMVISLLSACASTPSQETDIKQRAQARWDAVLAGDWDSAYSYYSPGYRSSTSRVDFEIAMRLRKVRWTSAEVQESSCTADACTLDTKLGYRIASPVPGVNEWKNSTVVAERWVRTDGQWWFVPEE